MKAGTRNLAGAVAPATVALVVALLLAGAARGLALYAYVLFLGAVGLVVTVRRTSARLPRTPPLERLVRRRADREEGVPQLDMLARHLGAGRSSAFELHHRLRPVVRQIAGVQLARRYGIDLDRRPERVRVLLGPRTWELVRPDREPPQNRFGNGWSTKELRELIEELESI